MSRPRLLSRHRGAMRTDFGARILAAWTRQYTEEALREFADYVRYEKFKADGEAWLRDITALAEATKETTPT